MAIVGLTCQSLGFIHPERFASRCLKWKTLTYRCGLQLRQAAIKRCNSFVRPPMDRLFLAVQTKSSWLRRKHCVHTRIFCLSGFKPDTERALMESVKSSRLSMTRLKIFAALIPRSQNLFLLRLRSICLTRSSQQCIFLKTTHRRLIGTELRRLS